MGAVAACRIVKVYAAETR